MNIAQLFKDLSYGELSNLSLANEGNGSIEEAYQPKIILAANEGLLRLHTKFLLKENELLLGMVAGITMYQLLRRFAESTLPVVEVHRYIKDTVLKPFTEDIIKIISVHNSIGFELPINDIDSPISVHSPQAHLLQVPVVEDGKLLSVLYQASHAELLVNTPTQEIVLPPVLIGSLLSYISYKVFSQMGTAEATAKAQEHYYNYELICQDVIDRELVSTSGLASSTRFDKRGWA